MGARSLGLDYLPYAEVSGHFALLVPQRLSTVGQEAPFDDGREQMKTLAGLEVTTKLSVFREDARVRGM
jgi:hypothetical protein